MVIQTAERHFNNYCLSRCSNCCFQFKCRFIDTALNNNRFSRTFVVVDSDASLDERRTNFTFREVSPNSTWNIFSEREKVFECLCTRKVIDLRHFEMFTRSLRLTRRFFIFPPPFDWRSMAWPSFRKLKKIIYEIPFLMRSCRLLC